MYRPAHRKNVMKIRPRPAAPAGFTQAQGHVLIEVRLSRLAQLFHNLDPAPFREKDLDPDAEAYLVESAEEIGPDLPIALVFELPAAEIAPSTSTTCSAHPEARNPEATVGPTRSTGSASTFTFRRYGHL